MYKNANYQLFRENFLFINVPELSYKWMKNIFN